MDGSIHSNNTFETKQVEKSLQSENYLNNNFIDQGNSNRKMYKTQGYPTTNNQNEYMYVNNYERPFYQSQQNFGDGFSKYNNKRSKNRQNYSISFVPKKEIYPNSESHFETRYASPSFKINSYNNKTNNYQNQNKSFRNKSMQIPHNYNQAKFFGNSYFDENSGNEKKYKKNRKKNTVFKYINNHPNSQQNVEPNGNYELFDGRSQNIVRNHPQFVENPNYCKFVESTNNSKYIPNSYQARPMNSDNNRIMSGQYGSEPNRSRATSKIQSVKNNSDLESVKDQIVIQYKKN